MRTTRVVVVLAMVVVSVGRASAASPEEERALAETLFNQGRELEKQGKDFEACGKFREALKHDPNAVGAILNVARCDEEAGLVASAARLFAEARDRARELQEGVTDTPLLRAAGDHIATLTPEIPYLALAFTEPPTADTRVIVNDNPVELDRVGHIAVDPGTVTIAVSQPGRVQYETKLTIHKRDQKAIVIPKLEPPVIVNNARRSIGRIMTISGAALGVGSIIYGPWAQGYYNSVIRRDCSTVIAGQHLCNSPSAQTDANKWASHGDIATAVGVVGAVVAVAGGYLWFSSRHEERIALVPEISTSYAGLAATGRF
jgi:hypothetical protein